MGVTRAQRTALVVAASLFVAAGVAAAFVLGRGSSSGGPSTSTSTTRPTSSATSQPTSTVPAPITATGIDLAGARVAAGWRTRMAISFDGSPAGVRVTSNRSGFVVTFAGPATMPAALRASASAAAGLYLMHTRWNAATNTLLVTTPYLSDAIVTTAHSVAGTTVYLDDIRPGLGTSNGCLSITQPVPYTLVSGIFTARGVSSAFEGVFTMIVRGGGTQTKVVVHAPGGPPADFSTQLTPPLESQPVPGTVVAYELSPKDGSPTCVVRIPIWLSPGG